jgi:hypothetical protein
MAWLFLLRDVCPLEFRIWQCVAGRCSRHGGDDEAVRVSHLRGTGHSIMKAKAVGGIINLWLRTTEVTNSGRAFCPTEVRRWLKPTPRC